MNLPIQILAWIILLIIPNSSEAVRTPTPTPQMNQVVITSPVPGSALQGDISIMGSTLVDNFQTAILTFAYSHDPTDTWFYITENNQPITKGVLAHWDTTTLTDGEYSLRVTVLTTEGEQIITTITGIRIRNYTSIETDTPTQVTPTKTPLPGDTPIPTTTATPTETQRLATLTPLPPNPIQLSRLEIAGSFIKGGLIVVGLFALGGIYHLIKAIIARRNGGE